MYIVGLDIGTSSLGGVVVDAVNGHPILTLTDPNTAGLPASAHGPGVQDPDRILRRMIRTYCKLVKSHAPVIAIGVTGQMHGILYVDSRGRAVSPLYTWQDSRGSSPYRGRTSYARYLSERTGHPLSTGFGAVTHYALQHRHLVPEEAVGLCTIADYVAMRLTRGTRPAMDITNAAGLGLFSARTGDFDRAAMEKAGIDPKWYPRPVRSFEPIGETAERIPVFPALGDNQASFLGAVADHRRSVLINIGTGSQVCVHAARYPEKTAADVRPFPGGGYLCVSASLCGGQAYSLLEHFFRQTCETFGTLPAGSLYDLMNAAALRASDNHLQVDARFLGTRADGDARGSIGRIGLDNLTPGHLTAAFIAGIVDELAGAYGQFPAATRQRMTRCVGSGNGLRRNVYMRRCCRQSFRLPLRLPAYAEEASYGAVLLAATGVAAVKDLAAAGRWIQYDAATK